MPSYILLSIASQIKRPVQDGTLIRNALEGCHNLRQWPMSCLEAQPLSRACVQARLLLEDPASEESILHQWDTILPEVLQRWDAHPGQLSAFSDGYRNASLIKDRVSICSAAHFP